MELYAAVSKSDLNIWISMLMPRDSIFSLIMEQLLSGQVINYHFSHLLFFIGRSIIRRSIKCRVYVLTYQVASLFCLSMFCRTA